jgi:hypothetical protein
MTGAAAAYLFLLGLACGVSLLPLSLYAAQSPRWVRALLVLLGALTAGRYLAMAAFAAVDDPYKIWFWHRLWFGSAIGLTVPGIFAVDALIRHPAMTPEKLVKRIAPLLGAYAFLALFAQAKPAVDRMIGWTIELAPVWKVFAALVQAVFVGGMLAICVQLIRKIEVSSIRLALGLLALAYAGLAADGILLACGGWYPRPFLFTEMLANLSLYHAFRTAASLQGGP